MLGEEAFAELAYLIRKTYEASEGVSDGLPLEIEGEEAFEDRLVGKVGRPAISVEDRPVEIGVSVREPRRALVVEVGQGPLRELVGFEAGRVEPAVAEFDEAAGRSRDRLAMLSGRAGEGKGLERRGWGVTEAGLDLAELRPGASGPELVDARVEHAEGVVVVACEPARVDGTTLARVAREREEVGRRLAKTRDVLAWQRDMAQLDAEEQAARQPTETGRLSSSEIVSYLRSLPALWADSGPDGRQTLATAIFARTEVLGFERMEYELTPDAIELGLDAALPAVYELRGDFGEFGRGERDSPAINDLPITMRLAEPPTPIELVRSA